MHSDNSAYLAKNARERARLTMQRAMQTLAELEQSEHAASTVEFAQRAKVSRSWVYSQADVMGRLQALRKSHKGETPRTSVTTRASDESLLTRLELAHQKIRDLTQENHELRNQIAHTLGDLRTARLGIRIDENHKSH